LAVSFLLFLLYESSIKSSSIIDFGIPYLLDLQHQFVEFIQDIGLLCVHTFIFSFNGFWCKISDIAYSL